MTELLHQGEHPTTVACMTSYLFYRMFIVEVPFIPAEMFEQACARNSTTRAILCAEKTRFQWVHAVDLLNAVQSSTEETVYMLSREGRLPLYPLFAKNVRHNAAIIAHVASPAVLTRLPALPPCTATAARSNPQPTERRDKTLEAVPNAPQTQPQ
eukprot:TRINITY_DN4019_c0_g1_i2.p4 TRINITY_DN4019_c0_g1~~TRINITY_DN4019_c0_g1_i2.p4  ORF type:complete len:155 (-),score=23.01 TRINITY_DN4019_c0_g1_i2:66-530(-)